MQSWRLWWCDWPQRIVPGGTIALLALKHLGYRISDQTVGNILKRHGIPSAPHRQQTTTWKEFIRAHMDGLVATDFFTTEVWTVYG